jgi:hypothetical protein
LVAVAALVMAAAACSSGGGHQSAADAAAGSGGAGTGAGGAGGAGQGGGGSGGAGATTGAGGVADGGVSAEDVAFCTAQLDQAVTDYKQFLAAYPDPTMIARSVSAAGVVKMVVPGDWTSGFPAGSYWLLYEHTSDPAWMAAAKAQQAPLYDVRMDSGDEADVGFIINTSFGNGYRLTQDPSFQSTLVDGANYLASRFNATVGATRSWDWGTWMFPVIVDNMMNLEILFHAAAGGGPASLTQVGTTHALTSKTAHFRPDGSSYQIADFNRSTGALLTQGTYAGLADSSTWSRGHAWAIYGFTMSYRYTHDQRFLDHAAHISHFWTDSPNMPADAVPYFDFDVPNHPEVTPLRDASAGAIAADGLLELARYATPADAALFRGFAVKALRTLSSSAYRAATGTNGGFLLMHAVGFYGAKVEVDVGTNYADYYYIEGLMRCASGQ